MKIIINLAGSPIAQFWSKSAKKLIVLSRINSIRLLNQIILEKKSKIEHFFCASAIGIYKSDSTYIHNELSPHISNSFLGDTVKQWELSCNELIKQNINVTILRIGLVLSLNGGLLKPIVQSVKIFLGTWFGKGENIYSWIHIDDLIDSILFLLKNNKLGVYNLVSPNPISSKLFTLEIGKVLNKKIFLPSIPAFLIKLITGSMSELFLFSQNVSSKKITSEGFKFQFKSISSALNNLLK
ncbi:MAG: TIGR01777 family protein [Flavobacteriales bacterium]|nr:TIGR01777 family protein [Flavobacteriales bacterium]